MKVKQRSTCATCRKRKISCDSKHPACSQCVLSGRECDGYPSDWTFVSQNEQFPSPRPCSAALTQSIPAPTGIDESHQSTLLHSVNFGTGDDDQIALIVREYMPDSELPFCSNGSDDKQSRICGSWVEVLPRLIGQTSSSCILSMAIRALAAAIQSHGPEHSCNSLASAQSYQTAVHALRKELSSTSNPFHAEIVAAIMCLSLVEVMLPDSTIGLATHMKGVEQLLQVHGSQRYSSGILHKLFVGFRPLLILEAFQQRRSTFLAAESWIKMPFSVHSPSPMQSLLNEVVIIPGLFEHVDGVLDRPDPTKTPELCQLFNAFTHLINRLGEWENALQATTGGPCYWWISSSQPLRRNSLWYPNITFANVYTHLWTFRIGCLMELGKLSRVLLALSLENPPPANLDSFQSRRAFEQMLSYSEQICASMEYLMQDEMKLFGPASTFVPLRFAYRVFTMDVASQDENITWLKGIVGGLVKKGLVSAPALVFG